MHLGLSELLDFYRAHRADDTLVLGTVVATEGSTYRKAGAMMLIAEDGSHCGLISGGCLESDLAMHARQVFTDATPRQVCYDMSHGDDFAFGLGLGCDGVIHLLLQRLERPAFGFLEALDQAWEARNSALLHFVTHSSDPACSTGDFTLHCENGSSIGKPDLIPANTKAATFAGAAMSRRYWRDSIVTTTGKVDILTVPIKPPPEILVCGAGVDAVPVTRLALEMGWKCTVVDHRSGFARADRFPQGCKIVQLQPSELTDRISLDRLDAAVLMTHNLGHDRSYLSQIVEADISYIGLLGPRARRDRLLDEINAPNAPVHGPAGLDIGAEMPESIALAIVAEIHAFLNRRDGSMLTTPGNGQ